MYGIYKDESYIHRYTLSIFLMRGLQYKKILDLHIHNNNEKLFNCLHNYLYLDTRVIFLLQIDKHSRKLIPSISARIMSAFEALFTMVENYSIFQDII